MILHVGAFPFPLPQGSQVFVAGMCRALRRQGVDVELACYDAGDGPTDVPTLRTPDRGLPPALHAGPSWTKAVRDADLWRLLRGRLASGDVRVVHAHNVEAPVLAALARLRRRPILLYQLHTTMADELPTYLPRPLRVASRVAGRAIDALVPRLCDAAVAMSEPAAAALGRTGVPVHRVDPGVDPDDLRGADAARARAALGLDGRPWVVYAGNLDAYQDLPILYAAMAAVPSAGLAVVTHDTRDPRPPIAGDRYRFWGGATFRDVRDALAAATVAAVPRQICAGTPIKLLNQLGLGVPTVAVRGAAPSLPGVILADPGVAGLAAALRSALAGDRAALGIAARTHVLAECTWDARATDLVRVYDFLSHGSGTRRMR